VDASTLVCRFRTHPKPAAHVAQRQSEWGEAAHMTVARMKRSEMREAPSMPIPGLRSPFVSLHPGYG
jgi:hypothetical protein